MCEIHIVGLDHFLQILKAKCWTPEGIKAEADQKRRFYEWLRELVVQNGVVLIAEEADFDTEFLGSVLARNLSLDYINITMPSNEWKTHGFRIDQLTTSYETRAAAYRVLESYMFERVQAHEQSVTLVMCGRNHLPGLQQLLTAAGHQVHPHDVYDCEWFIGRPE